MDDARILWRPQDWEKWEVGQKIWPSDLFKEGDIVDIHGLSIRKQSVGLEVCVLGRWEGCEEGHAFTDKIWALS